MRTATTHTANRWSLVAAAGLIVFMAQLDATIVLVALPSIQDDLGASTAATQWVVLAYVVPLIALTLLSGRWVDVVGRRRALGVGSAGFALASGLAGLAPRMDLLIGARIGQGAMAALLLALAPVLAVEAVTPGARGRALGVVSTLAPLGALSGPLLGGQLVDVGAGRGSFSSTCRSRLRSRRSAGSNCRPRLGGARRTLHGWVRRHCSQAPRSRSCSRSRSPRRTACPPAGAAGGPCRAGRLASDRHEPTCPASGPCGRDDRAALALAAAYTALLLVQFLMPFYLIRTLGLSSASAGLVPGWPIRPPRCSSAR